MSKTKLTRYSAEFKAKVALAAMRGDETIVVIVARDGIHPHQVSDWRCLSFGCENFFSKFEGQLLWQTYGHNYADGWLRMNVS